MSNQNTECRIVKNIYKYLLLMLVVSPLLSSFVTNTTILRTIELICFAIAIFNEWKFYHLRKCFVYRGFSKFLFYSLLIVSLGVVLRAEFPSTFSGLGLFLTNQQGFLVYLLPFLILPLPNAKYMKDILKVFFYISLIVFPLWVINIDSLVQVGTFKAEGIGKYLPFFSAFLLGFLPFFKKKQRMIIILTWAIYLFLMLLNARRNVSFTICLYGIFAYFVTTQMSANTQSFKSFLMLLFFFLAALLLLANLDNLASGIFSNMAGRATDDSRSEVEINFFFDFAHSPITDWIWGRGMDGGYLQDTYNVETGEISPLRKGIETGYLYLLLKGGLLYVFSVVLIMINALFLGWKNIRKQYMLFCMLVLASHFLDLYTSTPICAFSSRSTIFWFVVSVLWQSKFSNSEMLNRHFDNK